MAMSYSKIKIVRSTKTKTITRYGIAIKWLAKSFRHFLIKNKHINRWADSDQFVECILKMQKPPVKNSSELRIYWDRENNKAVDKKTLTENYNTVDWICALSGKPIKSKFMNFDLENFIHPEYYDALKAPMVDSRILKSSIEFRKECKKLLLDERQEFFKITRKNYNRD